MSEKPMTIEQAQAAMATLARERQARADACGREIADTLERHNCQLVALPAFTQDGRVVAQVQVMTKE